MVKKHISSEENRQSPMSDKTKGAVFLAMSVFALIMICVIIYARLDTTGHLQEKVITIQKEKSTK